MSRAALLQLLIDRLGLDPASLGERVVEHALAQGRQLLASDDDAALCRRLRANAADFERFAAAFLIPETWFFRSPEQFRDLADFARGDGRRRRPLRVLSLPCASGEEAWSAAITLLEAGLAPGEFEVLGIDLRPEAIELARQGRYRHVEGSRRPPGEPWLSRDGSHWQVSPGLARCVRFRVGNALDPALFGAGERFDAVFCRHLLIYLHPAAREQLLAQLARVLTVPALVLAGQSELLSALAGGFVAYPGGSPVSFLWEGGAGRRLPVAVGADLPPARPAAAVSGPSAAVLPIPRPTPLPATRTVAGPGPAAPASVEALPEAIRALADSGRLDAAREACLAHLARQPAAVDAWFLLATLESARGDPTAADAALGRLLYLQPEHLDGLEYRAALARRLGDPDNAARLLARARRLRQRTPTQ